MTANAVLLRRLRRSLIGALGVVAALAVTAPASAADGQCTHDAGVLRLQMQGGADTLRVSGDGEILVNAETCGSPAATVDNTTRIVVTGSAQNDALVLQLLRPFEAVGGSPAIPFDVDLGGNLPPGGDGPDAGVRSFGDSLEIFGSPGDDHIAAGDALMSLREGQTPPQLDYADVEVLRFEGRDGSDFLSAAGTGAAGPATIPAQFYGGSGDDELVGGNGRNRLTGQQGADILRGGPERDTAGYGDSPAGVHVRLPEPDQALTAAGSHAAGDQLTSVENVAGSAFDDTLIGNDGRNFIVGRGGDDLLIGRDGRDTLLGEGGDPERFPPYGPAGDDVIRGGAGADRMLGGPGRDVADYRGSGTGVTVDLAARRGSGGDAQGDSLGQFEAIIGSAHGDRLFGTRAPDRIVGSRGDDVLEGRGGADQVFGGGGHDVIRESASPSGSDQISGGRGRDTVTYRARRNPARVRFDGRPNDGERRERDNVLADVEVALLPRNLRVTLTREVDDNRVRDGQKVRVSGTLTRSGTPLGGSRVLLDSRPAGTRRWSRLAADATGRKGNVKFTVRPRASTDYRLRFTGDRFHRRVASARTQVVVR